MKNTLLTNSISVIAFSIALLAMNSCSDKNSLPSEILELKGKTYRPPLSIELIEKYGQPQTLTETTSEQWVAYFPQGQFTLTSLKSSGLIKKIEKGVKGTFIITNKDTKINKANDDVAIDTLQGLAARQVEIDSRLKSDAEYIKALDKINEYLKEFPISIRPNLQKISSIELKSKLAKSLSKIESLENIIYANFNPLKPVPQNTSSDNLLAEYQFRYAITREIRQRLLTRNLRNIKTANLKIERADAVGSIKWKSNSQGTSIGAVRRFSCVVSGKRASLRYREVESKAAHNKQLIALIDKELKRRKQ